MKKRVIVSACLLGINCRYDHKSKENDKFLSLMDEFSVIPICPEQLGGLPTPRPPSFFIKGDGSDTINGCKNIINENGKDVAKNFISGAKQVLKICKMLDIKSAILKENSPSCGKQHIYLYDSLTKGSGVTSSLLITNGINVKSENEL